MIIGGLYSFKNGREIIEQKFENEFQEVKTIIKSIDAQKLKTEIIREEVMQAKIVYSTPKFYRAFKSKFAQKNWHEKKIYCDYQDYNYDAPSFATYRPSGRQKPYREMDCIKNRVGVEVQFGKYAFNAYNICAKMTIFNNFNLVDVGIEVLPLKHLVDEMSTSVSYFERIVWDLEQRGIANIDIPFLVLGIAA